MNICVCSKIGEEQSPEDAEDGPPELLVSPDLRKHTLTHTHTHTHTLYIDTLLYGELGTVKVGILQISA